MMLRLTAVFAAAMLLVACDSKKDNPEGQPVTPAAAAPAAAGTANADNKAKVPSEGASDEKAPAAAKSGKLTPASTHAPDAKVEIIEISDFQCPFCSRVNPTMAKIKETYGDQVKLTFMHNPLSFHKDAKPAAMAAVAADKQGKFWEMHDKLFANQKKLKGADLEGYAKELGLDLDAFKKDMKDPAVSKFVDSNQAIAVALGATGTPAFFINGKNLRGAQPFPQFKSVIDAEIAAADKASKKGAAWLVERAKVNNKAMHDYVFAGKTPPKTPPARPQRVDRTVYKVTVNSADAVKGPADALVTLVEFSEFQCPFCSKILPTTEQLLKDYAGKLRIVFKHNPLPFHKNAVPASEASLCANEQGKFWEMHDVLFANQRKLGTADLEGYATELGLDMPKFKTCAASGKFKAQIEADQELAGKVTARGTPNTFINGRKLTGAKPLAEFKALIDEEMKKAEARVAKGIAADKVYEETIKNGKIFEPLEAKVNAFKLDDSPTKGSKTAKIQIVEFSDFQCPFCSRVTKPLEDLVKAMGPENVAVTFKHFPLSFHKQAMPAALASMCAYDQGKYWEMHDELFKNQKALGDDQLRGYAKSIELDLAKYDDCMKSGKFKAKIDADMAEGRAAGVKGTPSLYINGRKFTSPSGYNVKAFETTINKYLLKK